MGNPYFKFAALIIDSELGSRMRLKEATTALPAFAVVLPVGNFREALTHLETDEANFDLVFVSHHFPKDETNEFIKAAKQTPHGQDSAYVLLLATIENTNMAQHLMAGFDGILAEPYSINSLHDMSQLATRVKGERQANREKVAMQLLLTDLTKQLDLVAFLKSCGYDNGKSLATLKEMAQNLSALSPESIQTYQNVATKVFEDVPAPKMQIPTKKYGGVSQRVKERMAQKIMSVVESGKGETLGLPGATQTHKK